MDGVRLEECIARAFYPVHWAMKDEAVREVWLKGGRGSTKSSFLALEIVLGLLKYEGSNAIVYRKVADTLRDSVYAQLVWAIDKLGVSALFHCKVSPMEIVRPQTGQRILFRGADDPQKSKGVMLPKGYFRYLWLEELTEFAGMDDIRTIRASVLRGTEKHAITLYSYNPPMSQKSWVNLEAKKPLKGRLVHHSTYLDVPKSWLGSEYLANADALKQQNERTYRHMYLGEVTGTGGQVFCNIVERTLTDAELQLMDKRYLGLDFGFATDPDALIEVYYDKRTMSLTITREFYGSGNSFDTLSDRVKAISGRCPVICDSADPRTIAELRHRDVMAMPAKKGAGSVEHGLRWLQSLSAIQIDPKRCPNAAREFSLYEYPRDKNGNFLATFVDKDNHAIDAARYAIEPIRHSGIGFVDVKRR